MLLGGCQQQPKQDPDSLVEGGFILPQVVTIDGPVNGIQSFLEQEIQTLSPLSLDSVVQGKVRKAREGYK